MPHAMRIHEHGGAEKMRWEAVEVGDPGPGQVRVRNTAVGLNFVDIYQRNGLYPMQLPFTLGSEGAGVVEAVGPTVKELKVGDRVAYSGPLGAYAEVLLRPADRLVKIPAGVDDKTAAAMMLKGLTAHYLIRRTYRVKKGDTILMHAAAGGVGQILCQWAKHLGATVIGTVGSDEKAELAKKAGCKHVIVLSREKFSERVKEITKGKGVPVVYDGIGKDTFMDSLDCLQPMGLMASFGNASGAVPPFNAGILAQKGSLFLTRPTLVHYTASREDLVRAARELFAVVRSGAVKICINQTYPLREAAQAQNDLEARKTTGSTVLIL
ncbi:MAG: quinone oxidoreductase [Betaproteobacteria bacterium]|nr:quinone oxidoreductase [Betaproteobacteria bacterium]MDH3436263.1 quinone oxidoreductase [Betaproteobacteria bacterium]